MDPSDTIADSLLGTSVGRYRLVRVIGQGGMGRVYEGVDPAIGSRVAIKVIADAFAHDVELATRFFAEARAVNMIRHESIVNVLEHSKLPDGRPLIVMEYVEGKTLRDTLRAAPAPLGGLTLVMLEVLNALSAAHEIGIVHRDLKPDNILITPTGRAKVLDFGIAKLLKAPAGHAAPRTRTGVVLGTPEYMSPEQINGGAVDQRSDVYAMGVVLFEAVTRRRPFEGATDFAIMRAHVDTPPPRPSSFRADLPELYEQVMLTALAKQPHLRFATANAMAVALHAASATIPTDQWRSLGTSPTIVARPSELTLRPQPAALIDTVRDGLLEAPTPYETPEARARDRSSSRVTAAEKPSALAPPALPARARRRWPIAIAGVATAGVAAFAIGRRAPATASPQPPTQLPATPPATPVPVPANVVANAPAPPAIDAGVQRIATVPVHTMPVPIVAYTPTPPPTTTGTGWTTYAATWDPKRFDATAFYPTALAKARAILPDAELALFVAKPVVADGSVDVTRTPAETLFMFGSPSAMAARPASGPTNLPFKRVCHVQVVPHSTSFDVIAPETDNCLPKVLRAPRCTLEHVWSKAKEQGLAANLAASIMLLPARDGLKVQSWQVDTGDRKVDVLDDCGLDSPSDNPADPKPTLRGMVLYPAATTASYDLRERGMFSVPLPQPAAQLDAIAYVDTAAKLARVLEPDAHFTMLDFHPVSSDGHMIIGPHEAGASEDFIYWFYSPARAKAPPGPHDVRMCEITVEIDATRGDVVFVKRMGVTTCTDHTPPRPKCTFAKIWAKAIAGGATTEAPAAITYYETGQWWFDDTRTPSERRRMTFADDCR